MIATYSTYSSTDAIRDYLTSVGMCPCHHLGGCGSPREGLGALGILAFARHHSYATICHNH